jgi:hypothetical protein
MDEFVFADLDDYGWRCGIPAGLWISLRIPDEHGLSFSRTRMDG